MLNSKINDNIYIKNCRKIFENAFLDPILYDEGVEASRNACVAGASITAAIITCASWNDNPFTGLSALMKLMNCLTEVEQPQVIKLKQQLAEKCSNNDLVRYNITNKIKYGFDFVTEKQAKKVIAICKKIVECHNNKLKWCEYYLKNTKLIQKEIGFLNLTGLLAMYFYDIKFTVSNAEREFMLLKLNASILEAQKAKLKGVNDFPFFQDEYIYEGEQPKIKNNNKRELTFLMKEVGLGEFV